MNDQEKTKEQLIEALAEMRRHVAGLEKALQESQSAASVVQVAPLGIHEIDTKGRITFVNPSQEAITGFTANELVGTYIWDRVEPGPERDSLPAYLEHLVSEQPTPVPYFAKNIRKNGEVFDVRVDWNYKRNPQGKVIGFVGIVCDITEHRRAEEELVKSKTILQAAIDCLPFNFFAIGLDGRYMLQNAVSKAQQPGDAIGKLPDEVCRNTHDLAIYLDNNRRAFAGEKVEGEMRCLTA